MVVNSQDEASRRLHDLLQQRLSGNITLYAQSPEEPDVWQIANVMKDDFQIFDRCGRLTYHLSLPYTILSQPYVEEAIRNTYCNSICGDCAVENATQPVACNGTGELKPEEETPSTTEEETRNSHGHHGGHHRGHHHEGHHRGHHRGHQGGHHGRGEGHSHNGVPHQHGSQQQVVIGQAFIGQADTGQLDVGQVSQNTDLQVMQQP